MIDMIKELRYRPFLCTKCDWRFEIKTDGTIAPWCGKCGDSEYVVNDDWSNIKLEEVVKDKEKKESEVGDKADEEMNRHTWPYM